MYLAKAVTLLTLILDVAAAVDSAGRAETSHRNLSKKSKAFGFKTKKAKSSQCYFQINTFLQWEQFEGSVHVDLYLEDGDENPIDYIYEDLHTDGFISQMSGQSECFDEGDDVEFATVEICTEEIDNNSEIFRVQHALIEIGGLKFDDIPSINDGNDGCCCTFTWHRGADSLAAECREESYKRVLSSGIEERQLFALMEGDELDYHVSKYEEKKDKESSLGLCHNPGSTHHGRETTHEACFDPENQDRSLLEEQTEDIGDYKPWIVPSHEGATLLAENPGIWSIDNFLDAEELEKLENLVNKYGRDHDLFGPCKREKRRSTNAHPSENKVCFKISPEKACDGPYDVSRCDTKTEDEDSEFVDMILTRFRNLWPTSISPPDYAKFQISQGNTAPVDMHADRYTISFVMYLNDGGASMIFPEANVTVKPQKGKVHTWLNRYEDGSRNPMADHAVQAHPSDAGERGVMLLNFLSSAQEILTSFE